MTFTSDGKTVSVVKETEGTVVAAPRIVYRCEGKYFHAYKCEYINKATRVKTNVKAAKELGLRACSKCKPKE